MFNHDVMLPIACSRPMPFNPLWPVKVMMMMLTVVMMMLDEVFSGFG